MIRKDELRAAAHETRDKERRTLGEPPTEAELLAWSRGELKGEEAARMRELLVCYPDLARVFMEPLSEEGAEFVTNDDVARGWEALQRESAPVIPIRHRTERRHVFSIAAGVALVVVSALYVKEWRTESNLENSLRAPRVLRVELLMPDGHRGSEGVKRIAPDGDVLLNPALVSESQSRYPAYRIDVLDRNATPPRVLTSTTGLHPRNDMTFDVYVPRTLLETGHQYQIVIYGLLSSRSENVAVYTFSR